MNQLIIRSLLTARHVKSVQRNVPSCLYSSTAGSDVGSEVPYKTLKSETTTAPNSVPAEADVVVIGGGAVGCSTLYHLTKLGVKNVVLIERDQLTAGTTWHTAGLLWRLRPNDTDTILQNYTRTLIRDVLEEETGINPGWIENGGIFIASNKERLDEYKRMMTLGKALGIESHVLSPEETKDLYPLMNVGDMHGALYSPGDGTMDPAGYCTALSRAATKSGAKVVLNCNVTGIKVTEDDMGTRRVQGVETDAGMIRTNTVVNACGAWSPYIGAMAGVNVPLLAMRHAYIVSERIEGIQNMPNVRDHDASVYLKLQGDGLSIGGYEPNPLFWDKVENEFAFSLFELDWDVFSVHIDGAINRVPVIEQTGVKSTVCGPESFTADHKALIGESPEVRGFYLNCGFNSSGMMLSGGAGWQLAEWIVNGRPTIDMYSFDIRRFPSSVTDNQKWIKERSHEAYAKNYAMYFPHDEPLASRGLRKDALHKVLEDAGCLYQERHGWERPGWFNLESPAPLKPYDYYGYYGIEANKDYAYGKLLSDEYTYDFPKHHDKIGKECLSCRNDVAVFNMSYFGKFYLTGPDSQAAADWIFSNDMTKNEGSTVYTCMLNKRGGVEGDLTVSMIESGDGSPVEPQFEGRGFYVAVGGGAAEQGKQHILTAIQDKGFNCQLLDHSEDMCMISIQGPKSRAVLQALTNTDLSNENFPFSTQQMIKIGKHTVRAMRLSFVGELGWELHMDNDVSVEVYNAVMAAGADHGIVNAGYRAIDSLSIEKGYRHWHADIRPDDTPLEGGLAFTCKLKSDVPFLGREALEKQKEGGLKRRLACFTIDDHEALLGFEAIWRNDQIVGFIRRADYGFAIGKSLAYGYVTHPDGKTVTAKFLREGKYAIEKMGIKFAAKIHMKSPFDAENNRVKGNY
ncbi:sarcosine dehydrogenase, mitochondrial-like [Antedon mediterranea]|uniref:sarcosine dehydrogenase, mitochondrial-like n=1 Tax=Antedon mediterranea TaxID=105859 RepID=UPI003AF7127A